MLEFSSNDAVAGWSLRHLFHNRASMGINSPPHQPLSFFFFFSSLNHFSLLVLGNFHSFPRMFPFLSWCLFVLSLAKLLPCRSDRLACYLLLGSSIPPPLSQKTDALLCPFGTPRNAFSFHHQCKKMARYGRNIQRSEHLAALAALPAAVYPLVLGLLKIAFPAHYRKARTAVRTRAPSQRLPLGQYSASGLICRREAVCLFSMYSYYTSKSAVNTHLCNECLCVKTPRLHGKRGSLCTYE